MKINPKFLLLIGAKILSIIGVAFSFIWMIVEFLIYLIKDLPFNWWSVGLFAISSVTLIIALFWLFLGTLKTQEKSFDEFKSKWGRQN